MIPPLPRLMPWWSENPQEPFISNHAHYSHSSYCRKACLRRSCVRLKFFRPTWGSESHLPILEQRGSLKCLLDNYPVNETCLEEQEGLCLLLGTRQHHSLHVVLIFGFHTTTTTCPHHERFQPRSPLSSCSCAFLTWALIHGHLDKTATFLHFNKSKGSNGQCRAVLKMHCTGLHLHLHLRWQTVSPTGLNNFKEVNGITPCPFVKTKIWLQNLILRGAFYCKEKK